MTVESPLPSIQVEKSATVVLNALRQEGLLLQALETDVDLNDEVRDVAHMEFESTDESAGFSLECGTKL